MIKPFMNEDFLLKNETAKTLFHTYAKDAPIIDYHCHINPQEIALDRQFDNITQVWLGGDHYKWRLMRSAGVEEHFITGNASDYEKFIQWAGVLGQAIGNPLYHWSHLELKRYFDYDGILNASTADEVWNLCKKRLGSPDMSVRNLILRSKVTHLCTTDDPADSLNWHEKLAADKSFDVSVLPAFRPDKAMNIEQPAFLDYLQLLSEASGIAITSFAGLKESLINRMDYFEQHGCRISDHALEYVMYLPADEKSVEEVFTKRLQNATITREEELIYKTAFMVFVGSEYAKRSWVMQLHFGCRRNNNDKMFQILGPDTGYDCIHNSFPSSQIADFLNALHRTDCLPRAILYSLNPNDNAIIASMIGCFQGSEIACKIQQGSAWWFNDHKEGMEQMLTVLANLGFLPGFVGMLTDSRSFLSYTRHEYFRRILCNLLGSFVENGEFPQDYEVLGTIVRNICYENARHYFHFK